MRESVYRSALALADRFPTICWDLGFVCSSKDTMALVITMRTHTLLAEGGAKGAGDTVAEFVVGSCSFSPQNCGGRRRRSQGK